MVILLLFLVIRFCASLEQNFIEYESDVYKSSIKVNETLDLQFSPFQDNIFLESFPINQLSQTNKLCNVYIL